MDVLNIWGRMSVTRPWITGDCCWVTQSGVCGFFWMRLLLSLAVKQTVSRSFLPCVSLSSASCRFFPCFLLINGAFTCVDCFWRFPMEAINQRPFLFLIIGLTLLLLSGLQLPPFASMLWKCWIMASLYNTFLFCFHSFFSLYIGYNVQLLHQRLEFIQSALCQDFLLLLL